MRAARLGDDIDDFCVKCKRVMNHSVVSILNDEPAKVRCRTCHSDHDFRHEQAPPPKVDPRKAALFKEVLGNVTGLPPESEGADEEPEVLAVPGGLEEDDAVEEDTKQDAPVKAKPRKKAKV